MSFVERSSKIIAYPKKNKLKNKYQQVSQRPHKGIKYEEK